MKNRVLTLVLALAFVSSCALVLMPYTEENFEGAGSFSINGYGGQVVNFSGPVNKVVSMGTAFTSTLDELGCIDQLLYVDSSSKSAGIESIQDFADDRVYTTSQGEALAQKLAASSDFDETNDVVLIYSYSTGLKTAFDAMPIRYVMFYPQSYEDSVQMVTDIGKIMGKETKAAEITAEMEGIETYYTDALTAAGVTEKVNAVYASYSSNILKVGNLKSLSVVMLKLAGGLNPADDSTIDATTYEPVTGFFLGLEGTGKLDVVFVDPYYSGTAAEFKTLMGISENVKVVKLTVLENTYGPASLKGIEHMASVMYPEVFGDSGDPDDNGSGDNTMIYVAAGICVIILIVVAVVIMRR